MDFRTKSSSETICFSGFFCMPAHYVSSRCMTLVSAWQDHLTTFFFIFLALKMHQCELETSSCLDQKKDSLCLKLTWTRGKRTQILSWVVGFEVF